MTDVFFNCANPNLLLMDKQGLAVSDLSEAFDHADRLVRSMLMAPNQEDWRDWELRVTDDLGSEIFVIPFASVLGKPH